MGSGKSTAAINCMNEDTESNYIYITPYLKEVERVKQGCPNRNFYSPENRGEGKLNALHNLLGKGRNIVSTHSLFKQYNDYTIELIKNGNYKLIMDEVVDVVERYDLTSYDSDMLFEYRYLLRSGENVSWNMDEHGSNYKGFFSELKKIAQNSDMVYYDGDLLLWLFPEKVFEAFSDVTVLTYMFGAQIQKYYFDLLGMDFKYIGVRNENGKYIFTDSTDPPDYVKTLTDKIHIVQDDKLNLIGENKFSLSSSWYTRDKENGSKALITKLRNDTLNFYVNKYKTQSKQNMWTSFKEYKSILKGGGYASGFVSCNARATNEFANKTHLAYLINIYFNPYLKNFFYRHNVEVKEDEYALSELVQWIWRSAIRKGEDIWIYIPSKRMRDLLTNWLDELSK